MIYSELNLVLIAKLHILQKEYGIKQTDVAAHGDLVLTHCQCPRELNHFFASDRGGVGGPEPW